ncbi:MAG: SUMF1/EgtB/PvdO family nonheme iron enzyme, partial [Pirellulaceae bacterium]|nr:SUMF1/EgtB/PvdO family nonheme iron enzyme [Pirellulaceae bacterium]
NDPRPPRQIDPTIDRELQRICLKCLERQQRDRYPTADDLAEDLLHWIANPATDRPIVGQKFVSRGLRAFTAEDADFFLELLPGARDRNGLPTSVKFWLNRILMPTSVDLVTPIGVIFGPSGSGKSSFVRAGLVPLLTPDVMAIVVDCSANDPESRLLRLLSERLLDVPSGIGLIDLCAGVCQGLWRPKGKSKVLIVLDQLEQRLNRGDDFMNAELTKALRYCDGHSLQALLLCRDDFLTYLSRFTDSLGSDLREGENSQSIDLFDRKHARRILLKFGQAFGQLPDQTELTDAHEEFLQAVISGLATADYVVCVRLVMFAEMFRERPWTIAELNAVGGVSGIGEKFLDSTLGPESRDKRLRSQGPAAQIILAALLPPSGLDIRSGSKTEQELRNLAGLEAAPQLFEATLKSLDSQLKLISRVEATGSESTSDSVALPAVVFQLTHDSLIGSICGWLERTSNRTRAGRASLRLLELASQVLPGRPPRYLPTHLEWLSWQWLLRNHKCSKPEQVVWAAGRQRFVRDFVLGFAAVLIVGLIGTWWNAQTVQRNREDGIARAVDNLLRNEIATVPVVLAQLDAEPGLALPQLRTIYDAQPPGSPSRIRAALGLGPNDPQACEDLIAAVLTPDTLPDQLAVIADRLGSIPASDPAVWSSIYSDTEQETYRRFRAFVAAVCQSKGTTKEEWKTHGRFMAGALVAEPVSSAPQWLELLQPSKAELLPHFQTLFAEAHPATEPTSLALGIVALSTSKPAAVEYFVDHMKDWKTPQFQAAMNAVASFGCAAELAALAQERLVEETDPWSRSALSLALANAGQLDPLVQHYSRPAADPAAILAIHASVPGRVRPNVLRQIYRKHELAAFENDDLRRAVLLAFCLQASSLVDANIRSWLEDLAFHHIVNDPDAGCFSAAELLMRRLGQDPKLAGRPERRAKSDHHGILGRVMIDRHGLAFSIIAKPDRPHERIAVCTNELTYQEVLDYAAKHPNIMAKYGAPTRPNDEDAFAIRSMGSLPFIHRRPGKDLGLIYEYCNWLSETNGMEPANWSYPASWNPSEMNTVIPDLDQSGFRVLTSREWQLANRSSEPLLSLVSPDGPVIFDYAWSFENARLPDRTVGNRLPNAAGLFDMFGNVEEVCHAPEVSNQAEAGFYTLGQTVRAQISAFNSKPNGIGDGPLASGDIYTVYVGFRIMRMMPDATLAGDSP